MAGLDKDQLSMKAKLDKLPKKSILIPFDMTNPKDLVVPVAVNGVVYAIPRGSVYEVPDVIADVWNESYMKTMQANQRIIVQTNNELMISN